MSPQATAAIRVVRRWNVDSDLKVTCDECHSTNVTAVVTMPNATMYHCDNCGSEWTELDHYADRRGDVVDRRRITRTDRRGEDTAS